MAPLSLSFLICKMGEMPLLDVEVHELYTRVMSVIFWQRHLLAKDDVLWQRFS